MKTYIFAIVTFFILLSFIHPFSASAQCKYEKNEIDEFTGHINKQTKWERIASKNVMTIVAQIGDIIGFLIAGDVGCVNSDSRAYFKFQDDTVIEIGHSGKIDCGSMTSLILHVDDQNLKVFAVKPISKIRLVGTNGNMDVTLTDPEYFVNVLNRCFDVDKLINQ